MAPKRPVAVPRPLRPVRSLDRLIHGYSATSLGRYFRQVARASVAASLLAGAAGCADSHWPEDQPGFEAPLCGDDRTPMLVHGLMPAVEVDYVSAQLFRPGFELVSVSVDAKGTACVTATDRAACEAAVAESEMLTSDHLLTTMGDTVSQHVTQGEVRAFLGTVDTPQEAVLLVWHAGYTIGCGDLERYAVREVEGGYEVVATQMVRDCDPIVVERFLIFVSSEGALEVLDTDEIDREEGACVGRRPPGLADAAGERGPDVVGAHFAGIARLEAGAVDAFRILARELEALGAPPDLVDEALRAADDEVRHAADMGAVARRWGAEPLEAVTESRPLRSLFELALDNAVEGCVRETYGALVGTYQAEASADPRIAEAMAEVAEDETRHAALSWAIAAWAESQLTDRERSLVREARLRAVLDLRAEVALPSDPELARVVGLPDPAAALRLVDRLATDLWA